MAALGIVSSPSLVIANNAINEAEVIHTNNFLGKNDHEVNSNVQIVQQEDIQYLVLKENFKSDATPARKTWLFSREWIC